MLLDGAERQQDHGVLATGETGDLLGGALGERAHGNLPREDTLLGVSCLDLSRRGD